MKSVYIGSIHDATASASTVVVLSGVEIILYPSRLQADLNKTTNLSPLNYKITIGLSSLLWRHSLNISDFSFSGDNNVYDNCNEYQWIKDSNDLTEILLNNETATKDNSNSAIFDLISPRFEASFSDITFYMSTSKVSYKDIKLEKSSEVVGNDWIPIISITSVVVFSSLDPHPSHMIKYNKPQSNNIYEREYYWKANEDTIETLTFRIDDISISSNLLPFIHITELILDSIKYIRNNCQRSVSFSNSSTQSAYQILLIDIRNFNLTILSNISENIDTNIFKIEILSFFYIRELIQCEIENFYQIKTIHKGRIGSLKISNSNNLILQLGQWLESQNLKHIIFGFRIVNESNKLMGADLKCKFNNQVAFGMHKIENSIHYNHFNLLLDYILQELAVVLRLAYDQSILIQCYCVCIYFKHVSLYFIFYIYACIFVSIYVHVIVYSEVYYKYIILFSQIRLRESILGTIVSNFVIKKVAAGLIYFCFN